MKPNTFKVVAIPTSVAEKARRDATAGARAHQVVTVDAPHAAPCRHCLSWAKPGERVILFPYQSIPSDRPYAESGPIFVHADTCERYAAGEFPAAFRSGRALRGYNERDEIIAAEVVNEAAEEAAMRMLENPEVRFLHVRSASHGCYTFQLERA